MKIYSLLFSAVVCLLGMIHPVNGYCAEKSPLTLFSFEGTTFYYGNQAYDLRDRVPTINAVVSATPVGNKIVVLCHVNPRIGIYAIFDTASKAFDRELAGANLVWHSDDISTAVYTSWGNLCSYDRKLLKAYDLQGGKFISEIAYANNHAALRVKLSSGEHDRTDVINLAEIHPVESELCE